MRRRKPRLKFDKGGYAARDGGGRYIMRVEDDGIWNNLGPIIGIGIEKNKPGRVWRFNGSKSFLLTI